MPYRVSYSVVRWRENSHSTKQPPLRFALPPFGKGGKGGFAASKQGKASVQQLVFVLAFLLAGCSSLVTENCMAKLDTEVRAIQHDFQTFSNTLTPEQREKYARVKAVRDNPAFHEFYASLNPQQQATMTTLLERSRQVEEGQQAIFATLQQDLISRWIARQEMARIQGFSVGGAP